MSTLKRAALFLAAAGLLSAAAPEYFPLATGNRWVYRAANGGTFTIQVGLPLIHNDLVYYKLTGYGSGSHYARLNQYGNLLGVDLDTGYEYLITGFERVRGGWFDSHLENCLQQAQVQYELQEFKTPSLPPLPARELKYRSVTCADTGIEDELYAQNIGLVQRTVTTIAGPVTYTLVQASVGGLTYEADSSAGMRVLLGPVNADRLKVTMRVSVRRSPPVTLRFATAQRYDIRVRDDAGTVVYQWSEDVVLPAVIPADVVVSGDVDFVQEIPLAERGGVPLKDGFYTVEAWLNTPNREFAGAARLEVRR